MIETKHPAGAEMGEAVPAAVVAGFDNVEVELEA